MVNVIIISLSNIQEKRMFHVKLSIRYILTYLSGVESASEFLVIYQENFLRVGISNIHLANTFFDSHVFL